MSKKLSQIAPAANPPQLTDQIVGVSGGIADNLFSLSQVQSAISPGITVNTTTITGGTSTRVVYDNAGRFGEVSHLTINDTGSGLPPVMTSSSSGSNSGYRITDTGTSQTWDITSDTGNLVFVDRVNVRETVEFVPVGGILMNGPSGVIFAIDSTGLLTVVQPITVTVNASSFNPAFSARTSTSTHAVGYEWVLGSAINFKWEATATGTAGAIGNDAQAGDLVFRPPLADQSVLFTDHSANSLFWVKSSGNAFLKANLQIGGLATAGPVQNDASGNLTTNTSIAAASVAGNFSADHRLQMTIGATTYYFAASTIAW